MNKSYIKSFMIISVLLLGTVIIIILIFNPAQKVLISDVIFMAGLASLLLGGFSWIIGKGIYSRIFKNFKRYLKRTSKLESYVQNHDTETINGELVQMNSISVPFLILIIGIVLVILSSVLAFL